MKSLRDLFKRLPVDGNVRDILRQFNMSLQIDNKAKSVRELAEGLGFSVDRRALPRGMSGRLVQDPFADNGYSIEVNKFQSVQAQRWAVLHEIGHYFFHVDRSDPLADSMYLDRGEAAFYVNQAEEREANEFAAVLLFGDGALSAARSLYRDDLQKLARHFGVSEATVRIALKQF
ncbi:ImmA/IrrE family metallo-endopeptidase [Seohaeicola saemankumensis]|nr:ImmA/IrrE family metallo-endopeptidase [Seohaeicola saemankumensis]MCA0871296.1 ImmA/IrrE family metallo-endopeptidase [Seohaeicola saemankumensis]